MSARCCLSGAEERERLVRALCLLRRAGTRGVFTAPRECHSGKLVYRHCAITQAESDALRLSGYARTFRAGGNRVRVVLTASGRQIAERFCRG